MKPTKNKQQASTNRTLDRFFKRVDANNNNTIGPSTAHASSTVASSTSTIAPPSAHASPTVASSTSTIAPPSAHASSTVATTSVSPSTAHASSTVATTSVSTSTAHASSTVASSTSTIAPPSAHASPTVASSTSTIAPPSAQASSTVATTSVSPSTAHASSAVATSTIDQSTAHESASIATSILGTTGPKSTNINPILATSSTIPATATNAFSIVPTATHGTAQLSPSSSKSASCLLKRTRSSLDTPIDLDLSDSDVDEPKTKVSKKRYSQKARKEWLQVPEFKDWLEFVQTNTIPTKDILRCKYCLCNVGAKKASLIDHTKTKKHKEALSVNQIVSAIPFKKARVNTATSIAEARLSLLVAKHTSFNTVDHITATIKAAFEDSAVAGSIALGRTKCSAIIKNVWYPHFKQELRKDVGESFYSLLVDESTDISTTKQLGVVLKYFSTSRSKVVGTFLKLQSIDSGNAETIVHAIKTVLADFSLDMQKCVGIGTDNASVMVGQFNGVHAILKREIRHLVLVPCVCHSIQLAISEVCAEFFPPVVEYLISETYNWFARSSHRQQSYRSLFNVINDGHNPLRIVQVSQTRWLSVESAVSRILQQWDELRTHFEIAARVEKCHYAEQLFSGYNEIVKSYLLFVKPHLENVQRVNKNFQGGSDTDVTKLLNDLCMLVETTANVITVKRSDFDPFSSKIEDYITPSPYLGHAFETHLSTLLATKSISTTDVKVVRDKCVAFICNLVYSLRKRLPKNIHLLRQINLIAVDKALRTIKPSIGSLMEEFGYDQSFITLAEMQFKNLPLIKWTQIESTSTFWAEVDGFKDAGGANPYNEISTFAKQLLALPFSNAEVERVFSQLNLIKTKVRNRTENEMLNAVMLIRSSLKNLNVCCATLPITAEMVREIGTTSIYNVSQDAEEELLDLDILN